MPFVTVKAPVELALPEKEELLKLLAGIVADTLAKPIQYVMATYSVETVLIDSITGLGAYIEVKTIGGLNPEVNNTLAAELGNLIHNALGIPDDRIYISFEDVPGENWAWKGKTFR